MSAVPFQDFVAAVQDRFVELSRSSSHRLFVVDVDGDALYAHYLESFPEGSNPVRKVRTEHDCGTCKSFIRQLGGVVVVTPDLKLEALWDIFSTMPYPYNVVAEGMWRLVHGSAIAGRYVPLSSAVGCKTTHTSADGLVTSFDHLWAKPKPLGRGELSGAFAGKHQTNVDGLRRVMEEFSMSTLEAISDLAPSLYRGAEWASAIGPVIGAHAAYAILSERERHLWLHHHADADLGVTHFRGSVLGTLAKDLQADMDISTAVARFEAMIAPQNYQRNTALITPRMIDEALATLCELDLESAVHRRYAVYEDIRADALLFVDNSLRGRLKDGLCDLLMEEVRTPTGKITEGAIDIAWEDFLGQVLAQGAQQITLVLEHEHEKNFMALTAPTDPAAPPLFSWGNGFGWTYTGNATDSIKTKVKRAGGNVDNAVVRASLAWWNTDDLDLHCNTPAGLIYYGRKQCAGGFLDVDMNVNGESTTPVENIAFSLMPREGTYRFSVNQYCLRNRINGGFEVELVLPDAVTYRYRYDKVVQNKETILIATVVVKGSRIEVTHAIQPVRFNQGRTVKWGVDTAKEVPVDFIATSPNHWEESHGQRHLFFVLRDCTPDEDLRGIYNEFLRPELKKHRKVFEVLGEKTKCPAGEGVAGVGYTSGRGDNVVVRVVKDNNHRAYRVHF